MAIKGDGGGGGKGSAPKGTKAKARERERTSGALKVATPKVIAPKLVVTKAQEREKTSGALKPKTPVTVTVKPGDTNASIAERLGVNPEIAKQYVPVVPRVGTQITVPVTGAPTPTVAPKLPTATGWRGMPAQTRVAPYSSEASAEKVAETIPTPVMSGRELAAAREMTSGALKWPAAIGTAAAGYDRYVPATGSTLTPVKVGEEAARRRAAAVGVRTEVTLTRGQLGDAARYTAQTMFGGYDQRTGTYFTGAFDVQGNLVNPNLLPNILSPAIANFMGLTEEQRISLGYNPLPPYNLGKPGGGYGGGYSYSYGGGGGGYGGGGGGYARGPDLINWRIGL